MIFYCAHKRQSESPNTRLYAIVYIFYQKIVHLKTPFLQDFCNTTGNFQIICAAERARGANRHGEEKWN